MKRTTWMMAIVAAGLLALLAACSKTSSSSVQSEMQTAQKISKIEQEIDTRQQEMNGLVQQYIQQGGKDLGTVVGQGLTPDQTNVLEERVKNEQGIGYRDLVGDILGKQKAIEDLKVKVQDLEKTLPSPVDVTKGERHMDIAMTFLTKDKGLDVNTAKKLVQQVNLMDELVPGFKVWNFYNNGVYGTFVTQGDAKVSPYGVILHARQVLVNEKNTAISQRDALAKERDDLTSQVSDLTAKRDQLTQDVTLLQAERQELTQKVSDLQNVSDDLKAQMNSVFYRIGSRKSLVQDGMVRTRWFGQPMLAKFSTDDYPQHLDLRSADAITFTAQEAGVNRISRVKLAPGSMFKKDKDYTVSIAPGGTEATVRLLSKDKFKAERSMMIMVD